MSITLDRLIPVNLIGDIEHPTLTDNDSDNDDTAVLFQPYRLRANIIACITEPQNLHVENKNRLDGSQIKFTVSLLLTTTYDLSEWGHGIACRYKFRTTRY